MKKILLLTFFIFGFRQVSSAQFIIADIIKLVVKKVINAIDLAVQEAQNKTIVLQNAQKELENVMSELKLDEISDWVRKQKDLYQEYYNELSQVKQIVSDYDKVKEIVRLQSRLVSEYQSAYGLFRRDKHFTSSELDYMGRVYSGMLDESLKNLDQVFLVVNSLVTQMSDAERLTIINHAASSMQKNYNDLKQFNNENIQLSLQRASEAGDAESVRQLYGLP